MNVSHIHCLPKNGCGHHKSVKILSPPFLKLSKVLGNVIFMKHTNLHISNMCKIEHEKAIEIFFMKLSAM